MNDPKNINGLFKEMQTKGLIEFKNTKDFSVLGISELYKLYDATVNLGKVELDLNNKNKVIQSGFNNIKVVGTQDREN